MRLKKFISMLITTVLACAGAFAIHYQNIKFANELATNSLARFGLIILIPIYLVLYILTYGLTISSLIKVIKNISCESKLIKVISIIMLILILVLIAFLVYITSQTINLI